MTNNKIKLLSLITLVLISVSCSQPKPLIPLSESEVANETLVFNDLIVYIDGKEVFNQFEEGYTYTIRVGGKGALAFQPGDYGSFIISIRQFKDAELVGLLDGKSVNFNINDLKVDLKTSASILTNHDTAAIWVKHIVDQSTPIKIISLEDAENQFRGSVPGLIVK